jgi:RHS repeat-associated protein
VDAAIDGSYFAYTYDAVGNKLSDTTLAGTTVYTYDVANRLTNLSGGISYTWDANGNLLDDGRGVTYTYDAANRLIATNGSDTGYTYNGLGDRVGQVAGGSAVTYTLDLAAGLTQVLADGTLTYLYGNGRVAQVDGVEAEYFLPDALGSVRHLADGTSQVTLARRYDPYGERLSSLGTGATSYDFTGEWRDSTTNLIYLRARYYSPAVGRFVTRDTWPGSIRRPSSANRWVYSLSNPTNWTDPSGNCPRTGPTSEACPPDPLQEFLDFLNGLGGFGIGSPDFSIPIIAPFGSTTSCSQATAGSRKTCRQYEEVTAAVRKMLVSAELAKRISDKNLLAYVIEKTVREMAKEHGLSHLYNYRPFGADHVSASLQLFGKIQQKLPTWGKMLTANDPDCKAKQDELRKELEKLDHVMRGVYDSIRFLESLRLTDLERREQNYQRNFRLPPEILQLLPPN